jgi:hypothetical protein
MTDIAIAAPEVFTKSLRSMAVSKKTIMHMLPENSGQR